LLRDKMLQSTQVVPKTEQWRPTWLICRRW
jgi:hypothetical protein